jgi:hypothetical protein
MCSSCVFFWYVSSMVFDFLPGAFFGAAFVVSICGAGRARAWMGARGIGGGCGWWARAGAPRRAARRLGTFRALGARESAVPRRAAARFFPARACEGVVRALAWTLWRARAAMVLELVARGTWGARRAASRTNVNGVDDDNNS